MCGWGKRERHRSRNTVLEISIFLSPVRPNSLANQPTSQPAKLFTSSLFWGKKLKFQILKIFCQLSRKSPQILKSFETLRSSSRQTDRQTEGDDLFPSHFLILSFFISFLGKEEEEEEEEEKRIEPRKNKILLFLFSCTLNLVHLNCRYSSLVPEILCLN